MFPGSCMKVCSYTGQNLRLVKLSIKADSGSPGIKVHAVPVYVPAECSRRDEAGLMVKEFECVHTVPALLWTRSSLGQKVITVCPGYCYCLRRHIPGIAPEAIRCAACVPLSLVHTVPVYAPVRSGSL